MTAAPHDWKPLDAESGLDVRQVTGATRANKWDVRERNGTITRLTDAQFNLLRTEGLSPAEAVQRG